MNKICACLLVIILALLIFQALCMFVPPIAVIHEQGASLSPNETFSAYIAMQANQFALLQIYLSTFGIAVAAVGILLAVAAIWGYKELKEIALAQAKNVIDKLVPDLVKYQVKNMKIEDQERTIAGSNIGMQHAKNVNEFFSDRVKVIEDDPMKKSSTGEEG